VGEVTVLVLGGTGEGRELAERLSSNGFRVVSSLAGRVLSPRLPVGEVRVGGFGGAAGLAEYLVSERISAVVDATHPFAEQITANAVAAAGSTGTPLLLLRRPPWVSEPGDHWTSVSDLRSAATALADFGPDARVLLTVGRQGVHAFAASTQQFWLRAVDPPADPLPARLDVILDRGPFTLEAELLLLHKLSIDVLVTKNSGGVMTVAKLTAARRLGLPLIIVERPSLPVDAPAVVDVPAVLSWIRETFS
jgi:precorrin-6A/cobalt-precorrin-6A reductase